MSIAQVEKRRRNQLSPEFVGEESKKTKTTEIMEGVQNINWEGSVNNVPLNVLMGAFKDMVNQSLEQFVGTAITELKENVKDIKAENAELRKVIDEMKVSLDENKKRIEQLDAENRRNSLIIWNLPDSLEVKAEVNTFLKEKLKIAEEIPLGGVIKISKTDSLMNVKVDFVDQNGVERVFKNVKHLKGSKIRIDRDLTRKARENQKAMIELKKQLLKNGGSNTFTKVQVRGEMLIADNIKFHWDGEQLKCGRKDGVEELKKFIKNNVDNVEFNFKKLVQKSIGKVRN